MSEREYDTSVNVLGSIPNINIIIETIRFYSINNDIEETKTKFVEENAFGFNISSSRKRFFSLIKKLFLTEPDKPDNEFFIDSLANDKSDTQFKKAQVYLEVFRKNALFHDIIKNLIYDKHHENKRLITTKELFEFLLSISEGTKLAEFSEATVKNIASKYIAFMKRLDYFEEDEGYKSLIAYPRPSKEFITYIVYLLDAEGNTDSDIYNSDLFEALMLEEGDKINLLKKGSMAGYYNFNQAGDGTASFSLNYDREEIIDELFE